MKPKTTKGAHEQRDVKNHHTLSEVDRESVSALIKNVKIHDVFLAQCRVGRLGPINEELRIDIDHTAEGQELNDGREVVAVLRFRLQASNLKDRSLQSFHIVAEFHAHYSLDKTVKASAAALDRFAATNGVFNLWPYWREFVQSMSTRMGLPPLTVPSFRVNEAWTAMKIPDQARAKDREQDLKR